MYETRHRIAGRRESGGLHNALFFAQLSPNLRHPSGRTYHARFFLHQCSNRIDNNLKLKL